MKGSPGSIGFESKKADVARGELQTRLENVTEKKSRGEILRYETARDFDSVNPERQRRSSW